MRKFAGFDFPEDISQRAKYLLQNGRYLMFKAAENYYIFGEMVDLLKQTFGIYEEIVVP